MAPTAIRQRPRLPLRRRREHRRREHLISYRRIAVCLAPAHACEQAVAIACTLATEHGAAIAVIGAIEVPLEIPLDAVDPTVGAAARDAIVRAQAITESYGIASQGVLLHARDAGEAIVAELDMREADVVLVGAERPNARQRESVLPATTDYILKQARCPVMLIGQAADGHRHGSFDPVFRAGHPRDYWPSGEFVDHIGSKEQAQ
jgi:nucleotide-binding universal stress UspA family protein